MFLSERKVKILEAIINDYIRTAEPIGSRTIAKKYGLGISSATIRNEMSDLEEMGLIVQPYTSAGRVPSDKGYRLYVDELMHRRELADEEAAYLRQLVLHNMGTIDSLMQETAKVLAMLTNYTTIVSEPKLTNPRMRHVQFVPVDSESIIMVLVTDNKVAKNYQINTSYPMDYQTLSNLSVAFNKLFSDWALQEILDSSERYESRLAQCAGLPPESIIPIWNALANAVIVEDNVAVYTSGAKNILGFPEFNDLEKARPIFEALEEKEMLVTLLGNDKSGDISIVIGAENRLEELRNCSIIKANYDIGQRVFGSIGIIGPTRMDYSQVIAILNGIVKNINSVLKGLTGG